MKISGVSQLIWNVVAMYNTFQNLKTFTEFDISGKITKHCSESDIN